MSEPAEHRREIATFIAAIEQGKPAEDAVALIGLDRDSGANRIVSALLEPCWGGATPALSSKWSRAPMACGGLDGEACPR
jgi:hypothetical protein